MKRLLVHALCAVGIVYAIAACGGGDDAATTATATPSANNDKLTIVGSGS